MKNINLKKYNSYKLNCTAKEVLFPKDSAELIEILKKIKKDNLKHKVLGGGTNVIFENETYDGIIIKLDHFNDIKIYDDFVEVGSGVNVIKLILTLAQNNLGGLEFASGIPGTIGGAIYNNAGAHGFSFGDFITEVTVITPNLEIKKINKYNYSYRTSFFKENKDYIILSAKIKLVKRKKEDILKTINENNEKRKKTQPLNYPSAGSVFRNPDKNFAGKLIESINLKGYKVGGAMVSEKHANFIVNCGNATGKDIINLINIIKKEVKKEYNIELKLEQEIIK